MTTKSSQEEKHWQPKIDRNPEFNPFVNPLDRELENPPPLEESEPDHDELPRDTHALQLYQGSRQAATTRMPQY